MATPPKSPTLRERYDVRQRAVIDACARTFAERGYHGASIDDLIAATGLTRGGLYHYIGAKQDLLSRILRDLMGPLLERAGPIADGAHAPASAEERLRAVTRIWMDHVERHQDYVRVFQQERHTIEREPIWEDVRRDREAFERLLTGILRRGVRRGEFTLEDPALSALALLGMVNHTATWFRPGGRLSAEQVADGFCDLLVRGIGP